MYPYFQKNTPIQAAESSDPIRSFLAENPAFGTLFFQITGGAFPVSDASVQITKPLGEGLSLRITAETDESGKTAPLSLPAPNRSLSQTPNNDAVFAVYQAEITAPGYRRTEILDLPIFDGITTIQPVRLMPAFGEEDADKIEDTEPNL